MFSRRLLMSHGISKIIHYKDHKVKTVVDEIRRFTDSHENRLDQHEYLKMIQFLDSSALVRSLPTVKPYDLVSVY